jgi:hypothetical protein
MGRLLGLAAASRGRGEGRWENSWLYQKHPIEPIRERERLGLTLPARCSAMQLRLRRDYDVRDLAVLLTVENLAAGLNLR